MSQSKKKKEQYLVHVCVPYNHFVSLRVTFIEIFYDSASDNTDFPGRSVGSRRLGILSCTQACHIAIDECYFKEHI